MNEIEKLQGLYLAGSKTVNSIISSALRKIKKQDFRYHSVLHINDNALERANWLDQQFLKKGKLVGKLHGVPVLLKANIKTKDSLPTSCGSVILQDYFADENAFIVEMLLKQGAVILGKTNMSEFCNYVSNETPSGYSSLGGNTYSIWGRQYEVGGSSSGSAVAVAAGFCSLSVGTETDGSVVYPGAKNGVFAYKPTPGRIDKKGVVGISSFFDSIGFHMNNVRDLEYVCSIFEKKKPEERPLAFRKIFVHEESFNENKLHRQLLKKIFNYFECEGIQTVSGKFFPELDSTFKLQDIICQTEFKKMVTQNLPYTEAGFLELCQKKLYKKYHKDIREIERSFKSSYSRTGAYAKALNDIKKIRRMQVGFLKKESIDCVIAVTTGPHEIASIATMLGLPHVSIPIAAANKKSVGISIIGLRDKDASMVLLAGKIKKNISL